MGDGFTITLTASQHQHLTSRGNCGCMLCAGVYMNFILIAPCSGPLLSPLQGRRMRLREAKRLVQSHPAKKPQIKGRNPSLSTSLQETPFRNTCPETTRGEQCFLPLPFLSHTHSFSSSSSSSMPLETFENCSEPLSQRSQNLPPFCKPCFPLQDCRSRRSRGLCPFHRWRKATSCAQATQ